MSLKASSSNGFLNKAVIKSDIKRFWWVPAIYMLLLALFMLPGAVGYSGYVPHIADYFHFNTDEGILIIPFAIGLGGMVFSYLHKGPSVAGLHSLPVTKREQYFSHLLSAFVLLLIPLAVTSIVLFIECVSLGSGEMFAINFAAKYFYSGALYLAVSIMTVTLASMLTGSAVAVYVFTLGFIMFPAFAYSVANTVSEAELYGYAGEGLRFLRYFYLLGFEDMCSVHSLIYIAMVVVLFLLCLFLYIKRPMENYEELVAFNRLRTVFMYFMALVFGFLGYILFYGMFEYENLFLYALPLGIVALIAVYMLNRKSFVIKGIVKHIVAYVAIIGAIQLIFTFDLTGFERRIPNPSEVESIEINDVYDSYAYGTNFYDVVGKPTITDPAEIEGVIELHKNIVDNRKLDTGNSDEVYNPCTDVAITYKLKNGKTIKRGYYIENDRYVDGLTAYYNTDAVRKARFSIADEGKKTITYVRWSGFGKDVEITDSVNSKKLIEAIRSDVANLPAEYFIRGRYNETNTLSVDYNINVEHESDTIAYSFSSEIPLTGDFPATKAYIEGVSPAYKNRGEHYKSIDRLTLEVIDRKSKEMTETSEEEASTITEAISVEDVKDIQSIINYIELQESMSAVNRTIPDEFVRICISPYSSSVDLGGSVTIIVPTEPLPQEFAKYIGHTES